MKTQKTTSIKKNLRNFFYTMLVAGTLYTLSKLHSRELDPIYVGDLTGDNRPEVIYLAPDVMSGKYLDICIARGENLSYDDGKFFGYGLHFPKFTIPNIPKENYRFSVNNIDDDPTLDLIVTRLDLGIANPPADTFYNFYK